MKMWLLGLELWHVINLAPWHGAAHLKWATQGACTAAPKCSSLPKHSPVTLSHLLGLSSSLNLNDTFDVVVYAMVTVAFCVRKI